MAGLRIGIDARMCWSGGIGRYVRNLVNGLLLEDKDDTFVVLINPEGPPGSADAPTAEETAARVYDWIAGGENLEVVSFKDPIPPLSWREQAWLPQWCRERKLDLLHVPHFNAPLACPVPFVANVHDVTYLRRPDVARSRLRAFGAKILLKQTARRARRLITGTRASRDDVVDALGLDPSRIAVIGLGADEFLDVPDASETGCLDAPSFPEGMPFQFLLHVGNHRPHKGVDRLLDALAAVRKRNDEKVCYASLVFAGPDDEWTRRTRARAEELGLQIGGAVRFIHDVEDNELRWLYANAKALVLPSQEEGFGLPALEAAAAGLTIVATRVPAVHEVIGEDGAAWVPRDVDVPTLTDELVRVLSDGELRKSLAKRARVVAQRRRWFKTARQTLALYEEVLGLRDPDDDAAPEREDESASETESGARGAACPTP